jgi:hypothetical protein
LKAFGQLAGGHAVCLPERLAHEVLPDPNAAAAHRLVGRLAHRCWRQVSSHCAML